jgi:hypothetical protein
MSHSIYPTRLTGRPRVRLLAAATLVGGILVAGCGGGAPSPTTTVGGASTLGSTAAAGNGATGTGSTAPGSGGSALAFAKCMRANGVPSFPDPTSGGGETFAIPAGANPAATPAFKAAEGKCKGLLPRGGPPGAGAKTHPSEQTLAKLLKIAQCMRQHGVPQFPDPVTSVPSRPGSVQDITDFDGAILVFPSTINLQAPAYRQALAACGAPPLGLHH